jgi:hypothetical protein
VAEDDAYDPAWLAAEEREAIDAVKAGAPPPTIAGDAMGGRVPVSRAVSAAG